MTIEQELKEAIDGIGRNFEEFKAENNKLIAKGVKDALAEAKLDKLSQSIDDLTGKKEDIERRLKAEADMREELERKFNLARLGPQGTDDVEQKALQIWNAEIKGVAVRRGIEIPGDQPLEAYRAYKGAFDRFCRMDERKLTSDEVKALSAGSDPDGGYLVPADTSGRLVQRRYELSPIRQIAAQQTISTDRLEGINDTNEASYGWVSEVGSRTETNTPQIGKWEIPVHEMYANPAATQRILDDANTDIGSWLNGKVVNKFARVEGAGFITGTGVGQPRGFTTYTTSTTADATRAWGTMEHVVTGSNSGFHTTQADPLFDLLARMNPGYLANSRWVTTRGAIAAIRKFKTTTTLEYIWQPGLQAGQPDRLLGYPIVNAEDMPVHTTQNNLAMAFGDFSEAYQIVDRAGITVLRDPYTNKPYVHFYTVMRVGGGVLNFDAIKFIKIST